MVPACHGDQKSCSTRREISSPGRQGAGFAEFRSGAEIPPRSVCYCTPTAVPFDRTGIFVCTGVGTAREASIRNRHFDPVGKSSDSLDYANCWRSPHTEPDSWRSEVVFNSSRDLLTSSDSLDYANRRRSPHTVPACHSDQKSCSTRREISSPAKELGITFRPGIGIAYVTTIRNRHSETVGRVLVSRNSISGPKFRL
ncbi:hypothetical protein Taro_020028 [Colocasia esculenta]|uniref:Uncharacterized protein n=1 Tax=Colocasia esculenta TaxID=4460 RepID=A0A843UXT8_COLES|nr:hypothetical protein [Colocasia esculenta]